MNPHHTISQSIISDLDLIFDFYNEATNYMKKIAPVVWPSFDREMVTKEISEGRQWKMTINDEVACIWAITFEDKEIWEDREDGLGIYIHRIATHPDHRGQGLVSHIVSWSKKYAKTIGKKYIRLDTVGPNDSLVKYYTRHGFTYLGMFTPRDLKSLPDHYHNAKVCLFEMEVDE